LSEIRRVVKPGKRAGSLLRKAHEVILLRDRSRERRVWENWKSGAAVSLVTVSMALPRIERCSRFGRAARCRRADTEVNSLCSRVRVVMVLGSGQDISVNWFADAVRDVKPGNLNVTAASYESQLIFHAD
jgi:hypothetical protein